MTEAAATLEYETYDYSLPHTKTIDLIGEEFIKKEGEGGAPGGGMVQLAAPDSQAPPVGGGVYTTTLPPITYTTSILPSGGQPSGTEENGVLYCNLDDLSRYIPDNFNFDINIPEAIEAMVKTEPPGGEQLPSISNSSAELAKVQVVSLPTQVGRLKLLYTYLCWIVNVDDLDF